MVDQSVGKLFDAFADPTRRRVVEELGAGPRRASDLAAAAGASPSTMSRHLRVLLDAGVVADERPSNDARTRVFRLRPESMSSGAGVARSDPGALGRTAEFVQAPCREADGRGKDEGMTDSHSVTSSVAVTVDPATAFSVFTEELDCWWVQGPINFYDSSRAYGMRIEPGVGGRIVEVYDDATGDGLELAADHRMGARPAADLAERRATTSRSTCSSRPARTAPMSACRPPFPRAVPIAAGPRGFA